MFYPNFSRNLNPIIKQVMRISSYEARLYVVENMNIQNTIVRKTTKEEAKRAENEPKNRRGATVKPP